jgi:ACS family tartrate transporter-like MFS transporter
MRDVSPDAVLAKVTWRLIPFLFVLYVINILDRVNVGYARLQMLDDLKLSEGAYGFGAGLFYIGYFVFEVPSNLILHRVGARRWIARILISWGAVSCAMMFVRDEWSFYFLRLLLGVAEAGFFPGIILYLTYWFPARQRAQAIARFMAASPVAGVVGGPVSGAIMQYLHQAGGLAGWQWLFLLEGLPAVALGFLVLVVLTDRPEHAGWLTPEERDWLSGEIKGEETSTIQRHGLTFFRALADGKVWLLILLYFTVAAGANTLGAYMPALIKTYFPEMKELEIGGMQALSSALAAVGMVLVGTNSDRTGERRWHVAISAFVSAAGWVLTAWLPWPAARYCALILVQMGIMCMLAPFWSLATGFLAGTAAAGGIAFINSVGNLGGFAGPNVLGQTRAPDGSFDVGLTIMAIVMFVGGVLALCVRRDSTQERAQQTSSA